MGFKFQIQGLGSGLRLRDWHAKTGFEPSRQALFSQCHRPPAGKVSMRDGLLSAEAIQHLYIQCHGARSCLVEARVYNPSY